MNWVLGHLCAHVGWTGRGEPLEDGGMNEMTLPSRHRIRISNPGGLRPSTLPHGYGGSPQYWMFWSERKKTLCFMRLYIVLMLDQRRRLLTTYKTTKCVMFRVHCVIIMACHIKSNIKSKVTDPFYWLIISRSIYISWLYIIIFIVCQISYVAFRAHVWLWTHLYEKPLTGSICVSILLSIN